MNAIAEMQWRSPLQNCQFCRKPSSNFPQARFSVLTIPGTLVHILLLSLFEQYVPQNEAYPHS
jgi:hypothetical protein